MKQGNRNIGVWRVTKTNTHNDGAVCSIKMKGHGKNTNTTMWAGQIFVVYLLPGGKVSRDENMVPIV